MKIYYFESPNPRKVCAVAKHLKTQAEFVRVDLTKGENQHSEFMSINPNGKVPVLKDRELNLWESDAINLYLAKKARSNLWPGDDKNQLEIVRWLAWNLAHFTRHAGTLIFENYFKPAFSDGHPDKDVVTEANGFFTKNAAVLNDHLKGNQFVVNNQLSLADFALATILPDAENAKLPLNKAPEVSRWHERMMNIPAWNNPWPESSV